MNDYQKIAAVIQYLDEHHIEQPDLATLADYSGLSPFHFHRLFTRWAGITPKNFLQCLTLTHTKRMLREGKSVLSTALDAGLSGPGRLHDLCVNLEAASPGEIKSGGEGITITVGFAESPFGVCLVGESPRGICHVSFEQSQDSQVGSKAIRTAWPRADLRWDAAIAQRFVDSLFALSADVKPNAPLRAFVRGTAFQVRVWKALLQVPKGSLVSYSQLAESLGDRAAARAVGTAIGRNSLAYLIPCHRVIRETGVFGNYRWGRTRKRVLVAWERATASASDVNLVSR
ncbi:MAG: methylated-DNA--[protein]-cysteine S-methyltransferase [Planctomycetota bacterium]|nr:methylated-DNA--[protein]-cysteine S-methyltransferase [Planctomycetota bacterium]